MDIEKKEFPEYDGLGYETEDIAPQAALKFLIGIGISIVASLIIGYGAYVWILPDPPSALPSDRQESLKMQSPPENMAPLQVYPVQDWDKFLKQDTEKITSYQWINASQGLVRIPVERAKEMVLEKGLPVTQPATGGTANDTNAESKPASN